VRSLRAGAGGGPFSQHVASTSTTFKKVAAVFIDLQGRRDFVWRRSDFRVADGGRAEAPEPSPASTTMRSRS
jgi:hypothetical protein